MTRPSRQMRRQPILEAGAIGYDPRVVNEDPEPPIDRAAAENGGQAFVPFLNPTTGNVTIVQSKKSTTYQATFDTPPTPGNKIFCLVNNQQGVPDIALDVGGLTTIGPTIHASTSGSGGGARLGYRDVQIGDPEGPYGNGLTASNNETTIFEVSGLPAGGPLNVEDIDDQTGTTVEQAITPAGGVDAWLVGGFASYLYGAFGGTPTFTPNADTTTIEDLKVKTDMWGHGQAFYGESAGGPVTMGGEQGGTTNGSYRWGIVVAAFETGDSLNWVAAPLSIDEDAATYEYALDDSVTAAGLVFWRGTLDDTYLIASIAAEIGFESAGSVTITVQGANESDYSDAVTVGTATVTATGSYTSDVVAASWAPTTVYRYWQLLIDTADGVRVYEVSLLDPEDGSGAVDEHIADPSDAHDASAISVSPTVAGESNVQDALEALEALIENTTPLDLGNLGASETIDASARSWQRGNLDAACAIDVTGFTVDEGLVLLLELTGTEAITWDADVDFGGSDDQPNASGYTAFVLWSSVGSGDIKAAKVGGSTGGASALDDLTDVTITSPQDADRLRFNGSVWVNSNLHWEPMVVYDGTVMLDSGGNPHMHEVSH